MSFWPSTLVACALTVGLNGARVVPNLRQTLTGEQRRGIEVTVSPYGVQDDVNDARHPATLAVYQILAEARTAHNPEQSAASTAECAEIMLLLKRVAGRRKRHHSWHVEASRRFSG